GDVVLLEREVLGCRGEHPTGLPGWEALQLRDVVLDDEEAARFQMGGGIAKGIDLFALSRQVGDRVSKQKDKGEGTLDPGGGEIADHDLYVGRPASTHLRGHRHR